MNKKYFSLLILMGFTFFSFAQNKEQAKESIKKMCGCYEVDFEYAETFSEVEGYEFHDRYSAHGLEWIFMDEETSDEIIIQHLLVINDSLTIKHWREDWQYENKDLLVYQKNLEWSKEQVPTEYVENSWTQKVYQVDDSPRYNGYAHWVIQDGKSYWESQVSAPLPRREYTKRSDYNVMLRNNKHKITPYGHLHELDNAKVLRTEEKDSVIVLEKGHNTYTKVENDRCKSAAFWWENNRIFWVDVRLVWDDVIEDNEFINIKSKVDNQKLWQRLFDLGDTYVSAKKYHSKKAKKDIRKVIELYLSNEPTAWTTDASSQQKTKY